ncbi:hypothetical protein [Aquibacillus sediminis]|uniref:hypothetical protein n=1 Tax=Aquibacillus sediminis TaxID=2574734 RepID=UPI00110826F4|nr:hypothetical protein [Aquibacillus sediminis]
MKKSSLVLSLLLLAFVLFGCSEDKNNTDIGKVTINTEVGEYVGIIDNNIFRFEVKVNGEIIKLQTTSEEWGKIKELDRGEKVKITFGDPPDINGYYLLEKIEIQR